MPQEQQPNYSIADILALVFGRSPKQVQKLKGLDQNSPVKLNRTESIEDQLSKVFNGQLDLQFDRLGKYRDFDRMDVHSTECHVGLDIYAEEASQPDAKKGLRLWVESADEQLESELMQLLQRIKIEQKAYGMYRNIAKYGDCFQYLMLGAFGVHDMQFIHPSRIERVQEDGLLGFKSAAISALTTSDNRIGLLKPYDAVHFRIQGFDQESHYGSSYLDALRKPYKQLSMIETMITIYRISKAVSRTVFMVDVGQSSVQEAQILVKEYEKFLKNKVQFIDNKTGDFKLDFNPTTLMQDIVWPIRPGSATKIDKLESPMNIGPLEDLEQWKDKMRMGLNIPKDFFEGDSSGAWNSKEALLLQSARFSRKITRLQDAMREGIIRLFQIHWAIMHRTFLDPSQFQLMLGTISDSAERMREDIILRKAQILEILAGLALTLGWNRRVWTDYLLDEVYPLPAELRSKLNTPDPVDLENLEKEIILNTEAGTKITKHNKVNKPTKHATHQSINKGLQGFGESLENEFPGITEEFQVVQHTKSPARLIRFLTESVDDQIREANCNRQKSMGMSQLEVSNLLSELKTGYTPIPYIRQQSLLEDLAVSPEYSGKHHNSSL